jgi:hypothetical protein
MLIIDMKAAIIKTILEFESFKLFIKEIGFRGWKK